MTNVDENLVLLRTRALAVFVAVLLAFTFLVGIGAASAAPYTGGLTPTIYGSRADLNGDGIVNGADDSNAFYGDTSIIDGMLDCDTWGVTANAGTAGDGVIDGYDDCTLIGYDGSLEGDVILVVDGAFATANTVDIPDGTALPMTYNAPTRWIPASSTPTSAGPRSADGSTRTATA